MSLENFLAEITSGNSGQMVADFGDFPTLEASNSTRCLVGENSAGHLLGEIGAGFPLGENVLPTPSSLGETAAQLAVEQNVARPGFAENVVGCPAAPCLGENALPGPALLDQSVPVVPGGPGEQAATCRNAAHWSVIQLLSALFPLFANSKARSDTKRKTKFIMLLLAVLS